jgi:hypothetical protein
MMPRVPIPVCYSLLSRLLPLLLLPQLVGATTPVTSVTTNATTIDIKCDGSRFDSEGIFVCPFIDVKPDIVEILVELAE